jgi:hypothetical protein
MPRRRKGREGREGREGRDAGERIAPAPARGSGTPIRPIGFDRVERGGDGTYLVRSVPAPAARKNYRCPGCEQAIPPGVAHIVSIPLPDDGRFDDGTTVLGPSWARFWGSAGSRGLDGCDAWADERRHWHTPCWGRRHRLRRGKP